MDAFVLLPDEERRAYFEAAAGQLGLIPELVEKDFWVCWILKRLFSLKGVGEHLIFKGGTSLSKVYKAIRRFSEDVDISIERSYLGYGGDQEPEAGKTSKEKNRRIKRLQQACQTMVANIVLPELTNAVGEILKDTNQWAIKLDPDDPDKQTLLFQFPNTLTTSMAAYLKPVVKIEMGARSDHWPVKSAGITPYLSDGIPKAITNTTSYLRVLAAERTFWEKATLLHMLYHYPAEKQIPLRMSRHYYDIYQMSQIPILESALNQRELLVRVTAHKKLFYRSARAQYDEANHGTLRLIPDPNRAHSLETDYRQMQQMFFEQPPAFKHIIQRLEDLEKRINSTSVK